MVSSGVAIGIVCNVCFTVGIVLANKYLFSSLGFQFAVSLSSIHFAVTALATRFLYLAGMFEYVPLRTKDIMPLCIGSIGSVAFMNLNLSHNSVGFYQLSKLLCIPTTLLLQLLLHGKRVSPAVRNSLTLVLLGVGIVQVSDVSVNFIGTLYATTAVLSTAIAQIFTGSKQSELNVDHMQLLYHTAPIISIGMAALAPFLEPVWGEDGFFSFEFSAEVLTFIALTSLFGVGVNLSNYFVIGKTSPVTYQVVGHLKTCLIIILGYLAFQKEISLKMAGGIFVALAGMIWYSEVRRAETQVKQEDTPLPQKPVAVTTLPSSSMSGLTFKGKLVDQTDKELDV